MSATTNTSVWSSTPNWGDAANPAPGRVMPVGEIVRGPFQRPAPWTQSTWAVPLFATTNTSVWFGTPTCGETASAAFGGANPAGLMVRGPFQRPAPCTQETSTVPSLATLNTSVWSGTPNCGEDTTDAGVGADPGPGGTAFVAAGGFPPGVWAPVGEAPVTVSRKPTSAVATAAVAPRLSGPPTRDRRGIDTLPVCRLSGG